MLAIVAILSLNTALTPQTLALSPKIISGDAESPTRDAMLLRAQGELSAKVGPTGLPFEQYAARSGVSNIAPDFRADEEELLNSIAQLPEISAKLTQDHAGRIAELRKYVIKTSVDSYYYKRGEAPLAFILDGKIGKFFGLEDKDLPLYLTVTEAASPDVGGLNPSKQATDLARDMVYKNLLAEVLFEGAKSIVYSSKNRFIAVTAVYGDRELADKGLIVAKGGLRIYADSAAGTTKDDILKAIGGLTRAFIDLGTLGTSCMLGPDMTPEFMNVDENMEYIDRIGIQAAKDLGKDLLPLTTSGSPAKGYLSHDDWRATSISVLENLCAISEDKPTMEHFGIDISEPKSINIQAFGEVGSNVICALWENSDRYGKYNFRITGISDRGWAFYSPEGFPLDKLYEFTVAFKKARAEKVNFDLDDPRWGFLTSNRIKDPDDLLYKPATVLILAGPAYVFKNEEQLDRVNFKISMPAANIWLGDKTSTPARVKELEEYLLRRGILSYPSWMANSGGISTSKEEILHRYFEGGLDAMTAPVIRDWLRRHVIGSDIIDVAWVNAYWAAYLWNKNGYKEPLSEIMKERAFRIQSKYKEILMAMNVPASRREALEMKDAAIRMAKSVILAEDLKDALPELNKTLVEADPVIRNAIENKRRVAAYLVGAIGNSKNIEALIRIMEDDTESAVMYRAAASSLGYILEDLKTAAGPQAIADIVARISRLFDKVEATGKLADPAAEEARQERREWLSWMLRKVDGRPMPVSPVQNLVADRNAVTPDADITSSGLTPMVEPSALQIASFYPAFEMLQDRPIEIYIPQSLEKSLTASVRLEITKLNNRVRARSGKLADAITILPYNSTNLSKCLERKRENTRKIFINDLSMTDSFKSISDSDESVGIMKGNRLLTTSIEQGRDDVENSIHQAWLIKVSLLASLVNETNIGTISPLLEAELDGRVEGDCRDFIVNLSKEENDLTDISIVRNRVNYFLGKIVKLSTLIGEQLRLLKAFWTAA